MNAHGSFSTGGAFTTRFMGEEFGNLSSYIYQVATLVKNKYRSGSQSCANGSHGIEADLSIQLGSRDKCTGGTSDLNGFEFLAGCNAAAELEDNFSDSSVGRDFEEGFVSYIAGQGNNFGAWIGWCTNRGVPSGTLCNDYRYVCKSFYIINDGGFAP